jgi:hypothetical protein
VQEIKASGLEIDSQLASLVSAIATYASAHSGFNPAGIWYHYAHRHYAAECGHGGLASLELGPIFFDAFVARPVPQNRLVRPESEDMLIQWLR